MPYSAIILLLLLISLGCSYVDAHLPLLTSPSAHFPNCPDHLVFSRDPTHSSLHAYNLILLSSSHPGSLVIFLLASASHNSL